MATIKVDPSLSARANIANLINTMDWSNTAYADYGLRNDYNESDLSIITCRVIDKHPLLANPDNVSSNDSVLVVMFSDGKLIQLRYGRIVIPILFAKLGKPTEAYNHALFTKNNVSTYVRTHYKLVEECVNYEINIVDEYHKAIVKITPKHHNENPIYVDGEDYGYTITLTK